MAVHKFVELVNDPLADIIAAALGASTAALLTDNDRGKAVKLTGEGQYAPCADGNAIEGFVHSVDTLQPTVNSGYYLGGVQRNKRVTAQNVAAGTQLALGDFVVAATPIAVGTAGLMQVKKLTLTFADVAAVQTFMQAYFGKPVWRVMSIVSGDGSAGDKVLIERTW